MPKRDSQTRIRDVRRENIRRVLHALSLTNKPVSLADLSASCELSRPTMSQVLKALERIGAVASTTGSTEALIGGRPPALFTLKKSHHVNLIFRLQHQRVSAFLLDAKGDSLREESAYFKDFCDQKEAVKTLAQRMSESITEDVPLLHTVVAVMGVVHAGNLTRSHTFPELTGSVLRDLLTPIVGGTITIANDAKLATEAAWHRIGNSTTDPMIVLHVSEAVGCGIVVAGRLLDGAHGAAGELGSDRSSGWPSAELLFRNSGGESVSERELFQLAGSGDPEAVSLVHRASTLIAEAAIPLILGINPATVVFTGAIVDAGTVAIDATSAALAKVAPYPPSVVSGEPGISYVVQGAIDLVAAHDRDYLSSLAMNAR